jgi:carbonic anhydrase
MTRTPNSACPSIRLCLLLMLGVGVGAAMAQSHDSHSAPAAKAPATKEAAAKDAAPKENLAKEAIAKDMPIKKPPASATPKEIGNQVREALEAGVAKDRQVTLKVAGNPKPAAAAAPTAHGATAAGGHGAPAPPIKVAPGAIPNPSESRQYARARAAQLAAGQTVAAATAGHGTGHGDEVHWAYDGENGPAAWGKLKPEFNVCAIGKRQSPINIDELTTLRGPAEPIRFDYSASNASVVNNGHTIQVDVIGNNTIGVRGSVFRLLQFHFHHPSEERVNQRGFAMVAHLVHRNDEGQLAVVAVLLEPGNIANETIQKVWTYMPLDSGDRVRMPENLLNLAELLPRDQRYYQFIGSLTTPPCTEGVLWMVLKQPVAISREQLRLFAQLFPNNARPPQPLNGRAVRDAQ